jgi:predicted nucleic acid-binding protein
LVIDTSVWVAHLRDADTPMTQAFRVLLATRLAEVATTEPIVMEILAGATDDRALRHLEALTAGLPLLQVDALRDYHDAAAIYRAARRGGETVRKLVDCLIAAVVIRHDATLVHNDRDFDVIARMAPLRTLALPAPPRRRPTRR